MYDEKIDTDELGNPVAVAVASNPKIIKYALYTLGGVVGFFALRKISKDIVGKAKKKNVSNNFGDGTKDGLAAQFAIELYAAMHEVATWVWDGTDEEAMYRVAQQMRVNRVSFSAVANMYNRQFSRNLLDDMQDELSSNDLNEFNAYMNGSKTLSGITSPRLNVMTTGLTEIFNSQRKVVDRIGANVVLKNIEQEIALPDGSKIYGFTPKGLNQLHYFKSYNTKTV